MARKIRVGMIRCDTHGLWFAPLMTEHDPLILQRPRDPKLPHSHSWQRGGCHRFFYTNYGDPLLLTAPFVGGFEFTKIWDPERHVAEEAQRVFLKQPRICDTFEEVSDDVDLVFIAACNFDGKEHLKLATPSLKKGVPTFVDKPFADSVADARAMMALAKKHKAPIFSCSIPRIDNSVAWLKSRFQEIGEINFATLAGYGTHPAGLIHSINAIQHMFGSGMETVRVLEAPNQTSIFIDCGGKPGTPKHGVMLNTKAGARPNGAMTISVLGTIGEVHTNIPGDGQWIDGTVQIIRILKEMVRTRKTPRLMDDVPETIAVLEAFRRARDTGKPARIPDFLKQR